MREYKCMNTIKSKVQVTDEFVDDLITRGWQEIENLQGQIAIIDANSDSGLKVKQLLNSLLTSYYVFVGNLEGTDMQYHTEVSSNEDIAIDNNLLHGDAEFDLDYAENGTNNIEPFEYFVDFDEPSGLPISDEDLYG